MWSSIQLGCLLPLHKSGSFLAEHQSRCNSLSIPFSKELTDNYNYCALRFLYESIIIIIIIIIIDVRDYECKTKGFI